MEGYTVQELSEKLESITCGADAEAFCPQAGRRFVLEQELCDTWPNEMEIRKVCNDIEQSGHVLILQWFHEGHLNGMVGRLGAKPVNWDRPMLYRMQLYIMRNKYHDLNRVMESFVKDFIENEVDNKQLELQKRNDEEDSDSDYSEALKDVAKLVDDACDTIEDEMLLGRSSSAPV
jgi:hypothetical protein